MAAGTGEISRREMYAEIRQLCAPNNYTNWLILAREYAVYAAFVALFMGAYRYVVSNGYSLWWMAPVYIPTLLAVGLWSQSRLSCLVHESSHYLLFKNRVLNDIVANLFVVFPFFGKVSNYRIGHWVHHRYVNDPENDADLIRLKKHQDREFPLSRWGFFWEYVILQFSPHKAFSYLKGRAEYVAFQMKHDPIKNQEPLPRWALASLRIGYYGTLVGALTWLGWWPQFFLLWVVPLVTIYPASLFLREIAHHGNYPDNGDYTNSRVYEGKWLEREIFFPFGEWNHVLHHMFPTIPWHKMRQAHNTMMQFAPYRENVVICDGYMFKGNMPPEYPTVLDVLSKPSSVYVRNREHVGEVIGEIRSSNASEIGDVAIKTGQLLPGES